MKKVNKKISDFKIENHQLIEYDGIIDNIIIPQEVTTIKAYAFEQTVSANTLTIPKNIKLIEDKAFAGFDVKSVKVDSKNTVYDSRNQCNGIIYTKTNTLVFGNENTIIPKSVTRIGKDSFSDCRNIKSISVPGNVLEIGEYAFDNCLSLKQLVIAEGVRKIGNGAFANCQNLSSISIPKSLNRLSRYAFKKCISIQKIRALCSFELIDILLDSLDEKALKNLRIVEINKTINEWRKFVDSVKKYNKKIKKHLPRQQSTWIYKLNKNCAIKCIDEK